MKLYLIHVGFYDSDLLEGIYEQHANFFVVAKNVREAKSKTRDKKIFINKKMHIDGISEICAVDGYKIKLEKTDPTTNAKSYNYDEVKKIKN